MNMKAKISQLILATCLTAVCALAESDGNQPLVPLPSIPDFTRGDGWGLALGAAVEYESAYDGSDEYEIEFEPKGGVHYRRGRTLQQLHPGQPNCP
jgi:hypothetical protein